MRTDDFLFVRFTFNGANSVIFTQVEAQALILLIMVECGERKYSCFILKLQFGPHLRRG